MRVAITGSTGLIGAALARSLEARGDEVARIRRGPANAEGADWSPDEGWVRADAFAGCDAVVHLAGASIGEGRWTPARKALLRASRVDATRALVDALAALDPKPRRLVAASAVGIYGDRGDERLTEESARGEGFLADLTADWEAESMRAAGAGIPVALARFGVVLDREAAAFRRMALPFRLGAGGRLGNGRQWMPWVTLADAVAAVEHLLGNETAGPVNVVAPVAARNAEVAGALGRALRRPAFLPAPRFALRLALGELADSLLFASQRVAPERLAADGFAFAHPDIDGALAAVLRG